MMNGLLDSGLSADGKTSKDAELGRMFAWAGLICEGLWLWGVLVSQNFQPIDLTPSPLYAALALAGLFLLAPSWRGVHAEAVDSRPFRLTEFVAQKEAPRDASAMKGRCKVLVAGPLPSIYGALREALEGDGTAVFEQIESPYYAHATLGHRTVPELPDVVILPALMPVISSLDFLKLLRLDARLNTTPVIIWGDGLRGNEIRQLYDSGAASVIPGVLNEEHLKAFRQFCIAVRGKQA